MKHGASPYINGFTHLSVACAVKPFILLNTQSPTDKELHQVNQVRLEIAFSLCLRLFAWLLCCHFFHLLLHRLTFPRGNLRQKETRQAKPSY